MIHYLIGSLAFVAVTLMVFTTLRFWSPLQRPGGIRQQGGLGNDVAVLEDPQLLRDRRLSHSRAIDRFLRHFKFPFKLQRAVAQSGLRAMTDTVIALSLACGIFVFALGALLGESALLAALLGAGGATLPYAYLAYKKHQRLLLIEAELPDALDSISRAMQAGNSFPGALAVVGRDTPEPLGAEIRLVSEEINFGRSTREGLIALGERVDSLDMRYFVVAVLIHTQTGGNLTELLKSLSALIRDRHRLRKLGTALSAEGRLSAWILILMPFATAGLIHIVNPEFMSLLWTDPAGLLAVQIMIALMVLGSIWIWRIVHFRI
jgi:tight adherence protein B